MVERLLSSYNCPASPWLAPMWQFFAIPSSKNGVSFPRFPAANDTSLILLAIILQCRWHASCLLYDKHGSQLYVMTGMRNNLTLRKG
jgi:hypothetical protein